MLIVRRSSERARHGDRVACILGRHRTRVDVADRSELTVAEPRSDATGLTVVADDLVQDRRCSRWHSRAALVDDGVEHRLQVGRGRGDDAQHLGGAVCCSSASLSSRLRRSSSSNRRAFSMAMTAWSANVSSSAICCVE